MNWSINRLTDLNGVELEFQELDINLEGKMDLVFYVDFLGNLKTLPETQ